MDARPRSTVAPVSAEVYARARAAYLEHGSIVAVAEAAGIGRDLAARLIDSGEPRLSLPSLRDCARVVAAQVSKEMSRAETASGVQAASGVAKSLEVRAAAARRAREHESVVLGDAVKSREAEVRLVRANRMSALVLAGVNADLLKVSSRLAESLLRDVEVLVKKDARERMGILRTVAGVVHRTAQASQVAVNMERLLMGEPTAILGRADGTSPSTGDMTPEEAEQWLALANRAFARRAARRTTIDVEPASGQEAEDEAVDELLEGLEP